MLFPKKETIFISNYSQSRRQSFFGSYLCYFGQKMFEIIAEKEVTH